MTVYIPTDTELVAAVGAEMVRNVGIDSSLNYLVRFEFYVRKMRGSVIVPTIAGLLFTISPAEVIAATGADVLSDSTFTNDIHDLEDYVEEMRNTCAANVTASEPAP